MTFLEFLVFLRNWELGRVRPIDRSLGLGVAVQTFTRRSSTAGRSCWRLLKLEGWFCQDLIQHPCRNLLGCNGLFVPFLQCWFHLLARNILVWRRQFAKGAVFSPFLRNIRKFSLHGQLFHKIYLGKFGQIFCSLHFEGSLGTPKFRPFRLQNGFFRTFLTCFLAVQYRERSEIWFPRDLRPPTLLRVQV